MNHDLRPWRSALYIPGSNERALQKAMTLAVDAILFDLEDAVAPDQKAAARDALEAALAPGAYAPRARIVRINGADTDWADDDLAMVSRTRPDGVLLPKVSAPDAITAVHDRLAKDGAGEVAIWAMMETPEGILNAAAIAKAPGMAGFVIGTNDLAKDLGTRDAPDRAPLATALQTCVLAARAAGIVVLDGVYNAFKDIDGLRTECTQGRDWGMDGKTLIHPAQVEVANEVFAPDAEEIALAESRIAAFEAAIASGSGVAVLDGRIVENLHVDMARATLAKRDAIQALETA